MPGCVDRHETVMLRPPAGEGDFHPQRSNHYLQPLAVTDLTISSCRAFGGFF